MRPLGILVLAALLSPPLARAQETPSLKARLDPVAGVRFGFSQVCLPAVGAGSSEPFAKLIPHKKVLYPGLRSYWVGPDVTVSTNDRACTVRSRDGNPEKLREALLETVHSVDPSALQVADKAIMGSEGRGQIRQETYCLEIGRQAAQMLISTAVTRDRIPLQATVAPATRGLCSPVS